MSTKRINYEPSVWHVGKMSLAFVMALEFILVSPAWLMAEIYTETYETAPGGTGYAALLESPNGLIYDWYYQRANTRLAPYPVTVLPPGDEGFYWGNNSMWPSPQCGEP